MTLIYADYDLHGHLDGVSVRAVIGLARPPGPRPGWLPSTTVHVEHRGRARLFTGPEVTTFETPLGVLLTVTLDVVVDLGTTLVSFMLPAVALTCASRTASVNIVGIKSVLQSDHDAGFGGTVPSRLKAFNLTGVVRLANSPLPVDAAHAVEP